MIKNFAKNYPTWFSVVTLLLMSGVLLGAGWYLDQPGEQPGKAFLSGFLQKLSAGLFCTMAGLVLARWVAVCIAQRQFWSICRPLLGLIKDLRVENKLTGQTAQQIVCAMTEIFSTGALRDDRTGVAGTSANCAVCGLQCKVKVLEGGARQCQTCNLPGAQWDF